MVTIEDTTAPTINHSEDILLHPADTSTSIEWIPDDLKPGNYEIYLNGSLIQTGIWNSTVTDSNGNLEQYGYRISSRWIATRSC
ncbi:MAG: hypothetical protein ACTSR9_02595 [Candidatus Thorarchaeota archaeon]